MKTKGESKGKRLRTLTQREQRLCELIVAGYSHAEAYRLAYVHPKLEVYEASDRAWRAMQREHVKAKIAELREKSGAKTLLSLNDRLAILAEIAQRKTAKDTDKTRALDVYSKLAGDYAPQRVEVTGKDGAPVPVAASVLVGRLSVRAKLKALQEARAAREAAERGAT